MTQAIPGSTTSTAVALYLALASYRLGDSSPRSKIFALLSFLFFLCLGHGWVDVLSGVASTADYLDRCRWVLCLISEDSSYPSLFFTSKEPM